MTLTDLEREFLERLSKQRWTSPPLFDHSLVARLVEAGYVETRALPAGSFEYEITEAASMPPARSAMCWIPCSSSQTLITPQCELSRDGRLETDQANENSRRAGGDGPRGFEKWTAAPSME
jgi:hypothetical protein